MNISALIQATRNAKARTGNKNLGTCAANGGIQVVSVEFGGKGKSTVTKLSGVLPMAEAVKFLDAL